jgi:signal transduction histidine kinase
MTPDQFKALVTSKRLVDRRLAARAVAAEPTLVDRSMIMWALNKETAPQIRNDFVEAFKKLEAQKGLIEPPPEQAKEIFLEAQIKAIRQVTERILHQLNPLIGDIEQAASKEVDNYAASRTKVRIGQIKLQTDAITKLYNAAKPAVYEEFELAAVIKNCLPSDLDSGRCLINFAGPTPLLAQGDPSLVTIAVTNGLRNAIEASIPVSTDDHKPHIIISWNATDRDYWIAILDEGVGFIGNIEGAFEIGTSTKGHSGHGLPGIRAAMLSMSGSAELIPNKDKGCTLNLSWPIVKMEK